MNIESPGFLFCFGKRLTLGVFSIAKVVLLAICISKYIISQKIDEQNTKSTERAKFEVMESEVTGLKSVSKGNERQVADSKHESETVACDVHGREQGRLQERKGQKLLMENLPNQILPRCTDRPQHTKFGMQGPTTWNLSLD